MRRVLAGTFVPLTAIAVRSMRDAKGITDFRLNNIYAPKPPVEMMADYTTKLNEHAHPNPSDKKQQMEHLTRRPSYEYIPEFQRWANDMMAVYTDPVHYTADMAYHYHRVWKCLSPNHTWMMDGSGSFEVIKVRPTT